MQSIPQVLWQQLTIPVMSSKVDPITQHPYRMTLRLYAKRNKGRILIAKVFCGSTVQLKASEFTQFSHIQH